MRIEAHGLRIELPAGWSGHVFHRAGGLATLHAGDFALALGERSSFGDASTAAMPPGASFLALTEYASGSGLKPGAGLFAPRRIPRPLDPASFAASRLAHPLPGQAGMQHFFTASGRPFCLYVVTENGHAHRRRQLVAIDHVLGTLRVAACE
ncbi:MAG: hypothetical protein ACR2IP_13785 [Solirubrobacteraceae bacterium]